MEREEETKPSQARDASGLLVGPYLLLHELARGEHTTVHLARKQGSLGFQRLFTLKRLREGVSAHPEYVSMLVDEAHLTAGLHHANLLGVLDVGSEGGCYVVSDYVEGASLERLIERAAASTRADPHPGAEGVQLRFVLPLLVDALNGLEAIHSSQGPDDLPLEMVHQAPYARHVLVGLDGVGRLTDFSQARTKHVKPSRERADRLRLSYMAPEQAIAPDRVDLRTDLFIVGISLWEALTGESLFGASSEEQVFQNLLHRRIPRPSEVGRLPPRCFDAVCMRALERDSNARFSSAAEMARELRDIALNQALYATPAEIGQWVKHLLGQELTERRRKLGDMNSLEIALAGVAQAAPSSLGADNRSSRDDEPTAPRFFVGSESAFEGGRPLRPKRVSTLPYGAGPAPVAVEDVELQPTRVRNSLAAAAAPGAAREQPESRPGAYSQVDPSARRERGRSSFDSEVTVAPAVHEAVHEPREREQPDRVGFWEDVETSRYDGLAQGVPSEPASSAKQDAVSRGFKPKRPSEFPRRAPVDAASQVPMPTGAGPTEPPPHRRSAQTVTEVGPAPGLSVRHDSAPPRRRLTMDPGATAPVGPHGSYAVTAPVVTRNGDRWQASREDVRSVLESLPKTYEALLAAEAATQGERPLSAKTSISLAPPNVAEWTLPPSKPDRVRNWGAWIGSCTLAAIILLAVGVRARQWMLEATPSAASAREGSTQAEGTLPEELSPVLPVAPASAIDVREQAEPAGGLKTKTTAKAKAREQEVSASGGSSTPRATQADAPKRVRHTHRNKTDEASEAPVMPTRSGAIKQTQPPAPAIPENPY